MRTARSLAISSLGTDSKKSSNREYHITWETAFQGLRKMIVGWGCHHLENMEGPL